MKLTMEQVEARMTMAWGRKAVVVPYRISGNRYVYAVTDHGPNQMPLDTSWIGGQQVFEPADGESWPEPAVPDPWPNAVRTASELARAYFSEQQDWPTLKRLPRAVAIALQRNWQHMGDPLDTWLIPSCTEPSLVYKVNGQCSCPDRVSWCKHRLARALAKRAALILENGNGADSADASVLGSDSHEAKTPEPDTLLPSCSQAQRIDLIVAYEADDLHIMAHINANGQLIKFLADGQETALPVKTVPELYRWLHAEGFVPAKFEWLGWQKGLRQRRQTYVREAAQ